MQTYSKFAPTPFDNAGAYLPNRQDWLMAPVSITRDSDELSESNFYSALEALGGESNTVEVHRFGHWGPGWFEIIIIAPNSPAASIGQELENSLADYPILNEEDFSQREYDSINKAWDNLAMSERIDTLQDAGASIFAARRNSPWDIDCSIGDWPEYV